MDIIFAIVIGGLYAAGIYMMLRRSVVKLIIGLALLSQAANLLIFAVGRPGRGSPPMIPPDEAALIPPYSDPVPQALILTAIVISFAVTAFALILIRRAYQETGTDDLDAMTTTDQRTPGKAP
jgi:multicomponent Na+:H+ antiporter subunit C